MLEFHKLLSHRGAKAYAPENTLAAFRLAKEKGATWIEFDVMLSACGTPVVFHDTSSVRRTSNGRGRISELTLEEIKTLDAGRWFSRRFAGEAIPTLDETLALCCELNLSANIEIKPCDELTHETTVAVLSCLMPFLSVTTKTKQSPVFLISSFEHECLSLARTIAPETPRGLLLDAWVDDCLDKLKHYQCETLHINHRSLTRARVEKIKSSGIPILAYTVNRVGRAKKLLNWGVDAVFSDYPDLLESLTCVND